MTNRYHVRKLALAAGVAILLASPAQAANEFDQSQIEAFAQARTDIQQIQQKYSSRLQSTNDNQKAAKLQATAQRKMAAAVDDAGLTVEEFNRIAAAARQDKELQQEIEEFDQ